MYTYKNIFKQGLNIALKNPSMWLFGFFAAVIGMAGEFELIISLSSLNYQSTLLPFWAGLMDTGILSAEGVMASWEAITSHPFIFILALLLMMSVLAIMAFFTWAAFVSLTAVVKQSVAISLGKPLGLKPLFQLGLQKFWRVLGLHVALRIIAFVAIVILATIGVLISQWFILFFILFIAVSLTAIIFSFVTRYATLGVIIKNWSFKEAIIKSWDLVRQHWLITIEAAVLLFLAYWIIIGFTGYALLLTYSYVSTLLIIPSLLITVMIILVILSVLILVAAHLLLTVFYWACWAIIFELIAENDKNPIASWIASHKK